MKKLLLSLVTLLTVSLNANAQSWNMIVTHADGTTDTISTKAVKNVTFQRKDKNADQLIIKELYTAGVPTDNNPNKIFHQDKGFIIYNNCPDTAIVNNLAVGILEPFNGHAPNGWYENETDTKPVYESQGWVPAANGIWYFQQALVLAPYSQVVVSCMGSIDNTQTYSKSVNYANADYYAMYDPESGYYNTYYYPTPSSVIPTAHYLKAFKFGQSNAWTLSTTSPGFFIFQTKGVAPRDYASNEDNIVYEPGRPQTKVFACLKVPTAWIIDGLEVYETKNIGKSKKRFTADIDAGYIAQTYGQCHSLYRNVDEAATKAIAGNEAKLVYNYTLGTDPSGIDAEASIKKGAKIVYKDSNNSTVDFHERKQFSIRGN